MKALQSTRQKVAREERDTAIVLRECRRRCFPVAAVLVLLSPFGAQAYTRWYYEGKVLKRTDYASVLFRASSEVKGGLKNKQGSFIITPDSDPQTALSAALDAWNSVDTSAARFKPLYLGSGSARGGDLLNTFSFEDTLEARSLVGTAIAVTQLSLLAGPSLRDSDIYFSPDYTFSTTLAPGSMDLQAIATHELGHALAARHSSVYSATMWPYSDIEQTFRRTLSADDIAFVTSAYPAEGVASKTGTISGRVAYISGSPIRGASVVALDRDQGIAVSAMSNNTDGKYTIEFLPPGNYIVYATPLGEMLEASDLGLLSPVDSNWQPAFHGSAASPQTVSLSGGGTAQADVSVPAGAATTTASFIYLSLVDSPAGPVYIDSDLLPSGAAVEVFLMGYGFDDSIRPEDILLLGTGLSLREDSLLITPGSTPTDYAFMSFIIDVAPRKDWGLAGIAVRCHDKVAFADPLRVTPAIPTFKPSGTVNAASYEYGGAVPGEIASIFGTGLGPPDGVANSELSSGRLSTRLSGVAVEVDGVAVPLFYVSSSQINFQFPYEISGRGRVKLKVLYNGAASEERVVPVVKAAPGIFGSFAAWAILNQDFTLNSTDNPALPGSTVMVYVTGLGTVSPPAGTGQSTPASPLCRASEVTAKIADQDAPVSFAGMAPGFVGLAQVNIYVPEKAAPDDFAPVTVTASGATSQAWVYLSIE